MKQDRCSTLVFWLPSFPELSRVHRFHVPANPERNDWHRKSNSLRKQHQAKKLVIKLVIGTNFLPFPERWRQKENCKSGLFWPIHHGNTRAGLSSSKAFCTSIAIASSPPAHAGKLPAGAEPLAFPRAPGGGGRATARAAACSGVGSWHAFGAGPGAFSACGRTAAFTGTGSWAGTFGASTAGTAACTGGGGTPFTAGTEPGAGGSWFAFGSGATTAGGVTGIALAGTFGTVVSTSPFGDALVSTSFPESIWECKNKSSRDSSSGDIDPGGPKASIAWCNVCPAVSFRDLLAWRTAATRLEADPAGVVVRSAPASPSTSKGGNGGGRGGSAALLLSAAAASKGSKDRTGGAGSCSRPWSVDSSSSCVSASATHSMQRLYDQSRMTRMGKNGSNLPMQNQAKPFYPRNATCMNGGACMRYACIAKS